MPSPSIELSENCIRLHVARVTLALNAHVHHQLSGIMDERTSPVGEMRSLCTDHDAIDKSTH